MSQHFYIPGPLPGLNEILAAKSRNIGGHRGGPRSDAYAKMKAQWTMTVKACIRHHFVKPVKSARFVLTWLEPNKRRDKDNIAAGKKFIFDGLKAAGIITNDGWAQVLSWQEHFEVDPGGKVGVVVELFDEEP